MFMPKIRVKINKLNSATTTNFLRIFGLWIDDKALADARLIKVEIHLKESE